MMPAVQRQALSVLAELCELSEDVRLGQLLALVGLLSEDESGRSLWDIEDEELLAILYRHKGELEARLVNTPIPKDQPAAQISMPNAPMPGSDIR